MSQPIYADARSSEEQAPDLASSNLSRLLALGASLGAKANVIQTTTEEFSQDRPGISCVTSSTSVTFTFDDHDLPDNICLVPDVGTTPVPATDNSLTPAAVPPSPSASIISITSTADSDFSSQDPMTSDPNNQQASAPSATLVAPTPSSSPTTFDNSVSTGAFNLLNIAASSAGSSSANVSTPPAPPPGPTVPVAENRWYVVTQGRKVGVFRGWNNTAEYVVGVPRACYVRAGSNATALATFNAALDDGKVMVVP